jgi:hypothetical protein
MKLGINPKKTFRGFAASVPNSRFSIPPFFRTVLFFPIKKALKDSNFPKDWDKIFWYCGGGGYNTRGFPPLPPPQVLSEMLD